ncbi:DUF4389 domain-containing protein [Pseudomonas sp. RIT-PI-S]|uniref:DUF4389 domain-containing protein n=1 Tax=Pseudomonas sp. RIT-PI-S TaxID=3035295 RepID=UPI0021DA1F42|nr:DUF4389 domain-containing protein [Pseudomonas sp. RIT-PI-S]
MNSPRFQPEQESIALRVIWMLLFLLVWQVAQLVLGAVVLVQLISRLVYAAPNAGLMNFGDSLSRYLAQIGRFGCFHSEQKPWPFADWPAARPAQGEGERAAPTPPTAMDKQEPPL